MLMVDGLPYMEKAEVRIFLEVLLINMHNLFDFVYRTTYYRDMIIQHLHSNQSLWSLRQRGGRAM